MAKSKKPKVKPVTITVEHNQSSTVVPSSNPENKMWCLYSLDKDTNEINYLANNCKKTIKSIIKKRNQDLNQNTQNKGPFEWNKSNPLPTLEEFMKL